MQANNKKNDPISSAANTTRAPRVSVPIDVENLIYDKPMILPDEIPICAMLYGDDGTAKSGLALSCLTEEDIKNDKKLIVIDLDAGTVPLLMKYHKPAVQSGNIRHIDPIIWGIDPKTGKDVINYEATIDLINKIGNKIKETWKERNVKAVILDGGSKLLKYSEQQMRIEKALTPDGGVSPRYWIVRNKLFLELLELYKSIPVDKYFIMHEDFIPGRKIGEQLSGVKLHTNQMMHQKILCERIDTGPEVVFRATLHKSKANTANEGLMIPFSKVNKKEKAYTWEPRKILEVIRDDEEQE